MVGQMLDTVLRVIGGIVWFQRHAVVAHPLGTVFAKPSVAAGNLPVLSTPVLVHRVFFYDLPRSSTRGRNFWGMYSSRCGWERCVYGWLWLVRNEYEIAVARRWGDNR